MDRALDSQEKEKVRAARSNFFQILKRKDTAPLGTQLDHSSSVSSTQPTTSPDSVPLNKRFKLPTMSLSRPSGSGSKVPLIIRFYDPDTPPQQAVDVHNRTLEDILSWEDIRLERSHDYIQMLFPLPEGSLFNWEAPTITREIMLAFHTRSELRNSLRRSFERMLEFYGFTVSIKPEEYVDEEDDQSKAAGNDEAATGPLAHLEIGAGWAQATIEQMTGSSENNPVTKSETKTSVSSTDVPTLEDTSANSIDTATAQTGSSTDQTTETSPSEPHLTKESTAVFGYYVVRGPKWRKAFRNWAVRFDHNHLRITRILRCLRVLGLQTECDAFLAALERVHNSPKIRINERSMIFWQRAAALPLYIAPDGERCEWLRKWEQEQEQQEAGDK